MKNILRFTLIFRNLIGVRLLYVLILALFAALAEGVGISLFLPLINSDLNNPMARFLGWLWEITGLSPSVPLLLIFIVLFFFVRTFFLILSVSYQSAISGDLLVELREKMAKAAADSDYVFFANKNLGYFNNIMTVEINNITTIFKLYIYLVTTFLFSLVYISIAVAVNWRMVIILSFLAFPLTKIIRLINRKITDISINTTKISGKFQSMVLQAFSRFKYIKATGSEEAVFEKIRTENRMLGRYLYLAGKWGSIGEYGFMPFVALIIAAVIWYSVSVSGSQIVEVLFLLFMIKQVSDKILSSVTNYRKLLNYIGSVNIFEKTIKELEDNAEKKEGIIKPEEIKRVVFDNVHYSYTGKRVLEGISLEFERGRVTGILGSLGAGKSTVLNLITGLLVPAGGKVSINNTDLEKIDLSYLRQKIGYVSQEDTIFHDTVMNNITLWNDSKKEKAAGCIKEFGLEGIINSLPEGLETNLGESGTRISGGQRRVVFFLREMVKSPQIILLDEFTGAMDAAAEQNVMEKIRMKKDEMVTVLISHRLDSFRFCDWIYCLNDGKLDWQGNYEEFKAKESYFRQSKYISENNTVDED